MTVPIRSGSRPERSAGTAGADEAAVLDVVRGLLAELQPGSGRAVHLGSDLQRDLGLDSLAVVELQERLGRAFGVELPASALATATTPGDYLAEIRRARGEQERPAPAAPAAAPLVRAPGQPWPTDAGTLIEALAWHVETHPDLVSIRLLGSDSAEAVEELTYGRLSTEAIATATGLLHRGLAPGERVALMLPTGRDYFTAYLGTLLAGGVPVPLYPPVRLAEIEEHLARQARLLQNAGAALLVTVPEAQMAAQLVRVRVPSLRAVLTAGELGRPAAERAALPHVLPGDTALIQYTSGSTGDPKGVVLTHAQLLANIAAMGDAARVSTADVFVSWLPLYHDMGLIGAWLAPLYFGLPLAIMSPLTFLARPVTWLEAVTRYRGTLSAAPNFAYQLCVDQVSDAQLATLDLSTWRMTFNGSEPVSPETAERFSERFAACGFDRGAMCPAYGLAEVGVGISFSPLGRGPRLDAVDRSELERTGRASPAAPGAPGSRVIVSCGVPLPGYEVKIAGPRGRELPDRHEGAVWCRGPSATSGYFANEAANRALLHGDWLDTGDLGYVADGEVYLTGRAKDLVIRGGRKLHPEELEDALGTLDGVPRGGAAVFGGTDPARGTERLVVVVETQVHEPAARADLEAKVIATAVDVVGSPPDVVVLAAPGALLRTASGKIRRAATREAYEKGELGRRRPPAALQLGRFAVSGLRGQLGRIPGALRDAAFAAWAWLAVAMVGVPLWLLFQLPSTTRTRWALTRAAGSALQVLTGTALEVRGGLRPEDAPAVIAANHASFVDGLVVILASPEPVALVASTDLEDQPVVGRFLARLGCVFVPRGEASEGGRAIAALEAALRAGRSVAIFPEGSITRAPGLRAFHLGGFAAAVATGRPVVPVGIRGSRDLVRPGTFMPHRARIGVTWGSPIRPTGEDFAAQVALRDATRRAILESSEEVDVAPGQRAPT